MVMLAWLILRIMLFKQTHSSMYCRKIKIEYPAVPNRFIKISPLLFIVVPYAKVICNIEKITFILPCQNSIELRA